MTTARSRLIGAFGPNAWLVDDMYERYKADPQSVSESWREFFTDYEPATSPQELTGSVVSTPSDAAVSARPPSSDTEISRSRQLDGTGKDVKGQVASRSSEGVAMTTAEAKADEGVELEILRGASAKLATNMDSSLSMPTATSVRQVSAKLLEANRIVVNGHLGRTNGGKTSFTHYIAFAVVRALKEMPIMNSSFVPGGDGRQPAIAHHEHVGLGVAVDVERPDGTRTLLVPCIKNADLLDFAQFVSAYEELVRKVRTNKATVDDFVGTTVQLTNPGTVGTVHSVPRLMTGQGVIVGVGAVGYPAEYQAADPRMLGELGISKVFTLTSTYDHRVIQGATSGLFLARIDELLKGADGFYDDIFASLGVPYEPIRWREDVNPPELDHGRLAKQMQVQSLIHMYRVRAHLMANLDPLEMSRPQLHPELDPLSYGLTVWDMDRQFHTGGLAGREVMSLGEILEVLRNSYMRTLTVEYMHIQEPAEKAWIQRHIEGVTPEIDLSEKLHILDRLNAAEAFERFLHTRYVGQKRFGLEGAESAIVFIDTVLNQAAVQGVAEAVIGMAHRGRLNVLANIVGLSYEDIFAEFEGNMDPESVQGSGDVKYHKGASGKFRGVSGAELPVTLASNPSHLEAVDPVVEGMVRAKQDALASRHEETEGPAHEFPVLALLVHGDAAFAGQGVVAETLNFSGLSGYRVGGTVHLVIDNQLGFTTAPKAARTSVYPTDVARMIQAPIFHVNGDDPEACFRAAQLAFAYRQEFHKDVVVDMVCYRRHGHNEGDDPSYTQPLMYQRIDSHRSVRKLYTELLVRRGDITLEQAEQALDDFSARLERALRETRSEAEVSKSLQQPTTAQPAVDQPVEWLETGVEKEILDEIERAVTETPPSFQLHPKLARQFSTRAQLYSSGEVDWSLAEAMAFGSLLMEGIDVRLAGQDTRRGTFSQRHAVLVDYSNGSELIPLANLARERRGIDAGRFLVYDSLLSEYAALGFEYGYSVVARDSLVAWEAQFGDFANGGQIIIDNFLVAAEDKWGQLSGLVLLLPHGYEGQGPEHSSARMERFLSLCADNNMTVAYPTTAAQYFHLLRGQVRGGNRRPLVVFTPKSLLRARTAHSKTTSLQKGSFLEILDDPHTGGATYDAGPTLSSTEEIDPDTVRRVVLCSGKVAYDAMAWRTAHSERVQVPTAVVRIEQLYPWPEGKLLNTLSRYPSMGEVVFLQEEPENMGAWAYVHERLHRLFGPAITFRHVSRAASASTATGSAAKHRLEQEDILSRALG